jgi:hypothetical protein
MAPGCNAELTKEEVVVQDREVREGPQLLPRQCRGLQGLPEGSRLRLSPRRIQRGQQQIARAGCLSPSPPPLIYKSPRDIDYTCHFSAKSRPVLANMANTVAAPNITLFLNLKF